MGATRAQPDDARWGGAISARPETRCWSAQQSVIIRGPGSAQHRHLTVCRMDLHVHLLQNSREVVMKTYRRLNGEHCTQERNECALTLGCEESTPHGENEGFGGLSPEIAGGEHCSDPGLRRTPARHASCFRV